MSLNTHSKFYYGYAVSSAALNVDFSEGGPDLLAVLNINDYTMTDFCAELERALNEAGALEYTVSVNRATRIISISASGNFELLVSSGAHAGTSIFDVIGFTGADRTGDDSYAANQASGNVYNTQFILQSHIGSEDYQDATYATINKSASGKVEVVSFGNESFVEFNIKFATDKEIGSGSVVRTNTTGVDDLRALMRFFVSKAPFEFMQDEDDSNAFQSLMLEATADDSKGLKFKLKEMYGMGLPGFFETGVMKFRVNE